MIITWIYREFTLIGQSNCVLCSRPSKYQPTPSCECLAVCLCWYGLWVSGWVSLWVAMCISENVSVCLCKLVCVSVRVCEWGFMWVWELGLPLRVSVVMSMGCVSPCVGMSILCVGSCESGLFSDFWVHYVFGCFMVVCVVFLVVWVWVCVCVCMCVCVCLSVCLSKWWVCVYKSWIQSHMIHMTHINEPNEILSPHRKTETVSFS